MFVVFKIVFVVLKVTLKLSLCFVSFNPEYKGVGIVNVETPHNFIYRIYFLRINCVRKLKSLKPAKCI